MRQRQIAILAAMLTVFVWSVVMVVLGHVAAITTLAPALGMTVQQIARTIRTQTIPSSGHRVAAVPDKEDGAS